MSGERTSESDCASVNARATGAIQRSEVTTMAESAIGTSAASIGTITFRPVPSLVLVISVASIAGFKRSLSRVSGVRSVGVSSGPDGEFVFAVTHDPGVDLATGIAGLPGFAARITDATDDGIAVVAHEPTT